jgi:hypothetical protein
MKTQNIGLDLAVVGSSISVIGVIANNIFLDHILAMQIWAISNVILLAFFYGQYRNWWDAGLSSATVCVMYLIFTITNVWGLIKV